ncbi:hypothetical protein [Sinomicrobium sp. M5D2P9]
MTIEPFPFIFTENDTIIAERGIYRATENDEVSTDFLPPTFIRFGSIDPVPGKLILYMHPDIDRFIRESRKSKRFMYFLKNQQVADFIVVNIHVQDINTLVNDLYMTEEGISSDKADNLWRARPSKIKEIECKPIVYDPFSSVYCHVGNSVNHILKLYKITYGR